MEAYNLIGRNYNDSNLSKIQEYLKSGGNPNFQFYCGVTVFMEALCFPTDNIGVINELINAGADVNLSNHLGTTPLHMAMFYRKRLVVERLLQAGASVNAKDFLGRTVLHTAVVTWVLLFPGVLIQYEPDILIIKELLKQKDINCNQVDFYGETPLMMAVKNQQIEIATILLRHYASPNIGNKFSITPLHEAFSLPGQYVQIKLLSGGASIYSLDNRGKTPLDVLIEDGLDIRGHAMVCNILKVIALKYSITIHLRRKFELVARLSQVFNQYCNEADRMRNDFIYGNITMHDFMWGCFAESDPDIHIQHIYILQIHKAVVERLVRNVYPEYFIDIVIKIPKSSFCQILQIIAVRKRRLRNLALLFSNLYVNEAICKYLSHDQVFDLIQAFSDVTISE